MDIGIVSMRYAKALMEYAKSMGAEDTLYKEFTEQLLWQYVHRGQR